MLKEDGGCRDDLKLHRFKSVDDGTLTSQTQATRNKLTNHEYSILPRNNGMDLVVLFSHVHPAKDSLEHLSTCWVHPQTGETMVHLHLRGQVKYPTQASL